MPSIVTGVEAIRPCGVCSLLLPRDWILYGRHMAIPPSAVERHVASKARIAKVLSASPSVEVRRPDSASCRRFA